MSWSIYRSGRAAALAAVVTADLAGIKCSEPEQSIKSAVGDLIAQSLAAFPPGSAVKVEASGSQYTPDSAKPDEKVNQVKLSIEPIHGFVE